MLKTFFQLVIVLGICMNISACSNTISWDEEVKLNDGRMIVVTQKKLMDHGIDREAWLTFSLPEFSKAEILWHENLTPIVLNVHDGRLYLIGLPQTRIEFYKYAMPRPSYVPFRWEGGGWQRIPFAEVPVAIYDVNMLIDSTPPEGTKILTWPTKTSAEVNGKAGYPKEIRRLDPQYVNGNDPDASKFELQRLERAKQERERVKQEKLQPSSNDRRADSPDK